jgi:carbon-monoxide dehydrogenase small subunit
MPSVSLTVNGQPVTVEVENRTLLVQLLRDRLSLTGTHIGCDTSQCGACVVHLDGVSIKSCTILAVQCENAEVVTIEGIASSARLHPMQEAFNLKHGLQCGYCTPGMIMSLIDLLRVEPHPDEHAVRKWLEGNICRCTGYQSIVDAALECAQRQNGGANAHV